MTDKALRYNEGKLALNLVDDVAIAELAKVLQFGAQKYGPYNWQKGMSWDECYGSLLRHLAAWHKGEDYDSESKQLHMAHAMCNAMFLIHFAVTNKGIDDRPKSRPLIEGEKEKEKYDPNEHAIAYAATVPAPPRFRAWLPTEPAP